MYELSLFSGAGGGCLGALLAGVTTIGYVEWEPYACAVLQQRIADGILPVAPVFNCDARDFVRSGMAAQYQGVDIVSAGFPCQPFSAAGRRQGGADDRNMWPATLGAISAIRPRYALLENVPGLIVHPYIRRIFGDLAEIGYDARWDVVSAAQVGAPHRRERVWIVADAGSL